MNNDVISPVFVVGTPRSGTTLTAKILGRHPELFMPGETHFFDDIYARRDELGRPAEGASAIADRLMTLYGRYNETADQMRIESLTTKEKLAEKVKRCRDYEEIFSLFMGLQMEAESRTIWGNNAPRDIFNAAEIHEFYPNAKLIVCVRDVRDFLGSYKGKWRSTAEEEVGRLKKLYHPLITSLLWKSSIKQKGRIDSIFSEENVHVQHYENLVLDPAISVKKLCEFLGLEFDEAMLDVGFSNSSEGEKADREIFSSSVNSWRNRIVDEEAWFAQKICRIEMNELGYWCDELKIKPTRVLWLAMTAPYTLWRGLQANKHKRGPLLPYLVKRLSVVLKR